MALPATPAKPFIGIVDDNMQFRTAMTRVLEAAGFNPKAFGSVADFIRSGSLARIRCLVLDVTMPEIDGFALQECLRSTNFDLPIIFCSGVESHSVATRALANGAVSFLRKPVSATQLIEAVRTACASHPPQSVRKSRAHETSGAASGR